jgi:hypothetical protein
VKTRMHSRMVVEFDKECDGAAEFLRERINDLRLDGVTVETVSRTYARDSLLITDTTGGQLEIVRDLIDRWIEALAELGALDCSVGWLGSVWHQSSDEPVGDVGHLSVVRERLAAVKP